uniref:Serpin peptidase inhibitor, clade A (alpha-1 antiproteinase, antitrypsin), member 10a n=1 Tax=Maylandia zebra TaxID=106582 RepID=A0A3P9CD42_9CICH
HDVSTPMLHSRYGVLGMQLKTSALQDLISRNADFGARLYRVLAARTDENVLLCPFTLSAALTVLLSATNGQTREQLQAGLTLTRLDAQTLPGGFKVKGHQILVVVQVLSGAPVVQVASSYLNLVQTKLGGTVQGVDYTNAYEAINTINQWALEQTVDQVQDFISEVDHQTQLLLAAVTAYRASFTPPFNASSTQDERFYVDSYHVVMVPMMFRADKYLLAYDIHFALWPIEGSKRRKYECSSVCAHTFLLCTDLCEE